MDGKKFLEICRRSSKPIVALKGGKSNKGAKAAMSHTASLSGNHGVVYAAFAQAGVVEADDFRQLMDLGEPFARIPQLIFREIGHIIPGRNRPDCREARIRLAIGKTSRGA